MEPEKKSNGALVGLVIIIIILIIGGVYMWMTNKKASEKMQNSQAQSEALSKQDADALNSLDEDSKGTDASVGIDVNTVQ